MTTRCTWLDTSALRTKLVLYPTMILLFGLVATAAFIVHGARARVEAELRSGTRLGQLLLHDALREVAAVSDPSTALAQLAASLPPVRHVQFVVEPSAASALPTINSAIPAINHATGRQPVTETGARAITAPRWFARLLAPPQLDQRFSVIASGQVIGVVDMRANPADEISEIWSEVQLLAALLVGLWLVITAALVATVARSVRPLRQLANAFDRLEHGRFEPLPPIAVAELHRIGLRFNSLGRALDQARANNHLLIDRLMSLQETERKELARELHDEVGPSLFAIRADAACIRRCLSDPARHGQDIAERALSITTLAEGLQKVNYQLLERLRPLLLEQMGLLDGLRQLVETWRSRYPEIDWSIELAHDIGPIEEQLGLTLYRAAQECLTNAVRHAQANRVALTLAHERDGTIALAVCDNGRGLTESFRFGFGLLGMNERVRRLRGRLKVRNATGGGTLVELRLPLAAAVEA
jgi:two-component system sensor histidine kinase UhpB